MIGKARSSTFHGRDIFSPAGAHVARGDDWNEVGPALDVKSLVRLDLEAPTVDDKGLHGEVIATDGPFGNLVTNVDAEEFLKLGYQRGDTVPLMLGDRKIDLKFVKTFSDVPLKTPLIYIDSRGRFGLAVNQASFAATYGIKPPVKFTIPRR
jgi:S-adenosylmethionine hydrolase